MGCEGTPENSESSASRSVQLNITEFYRSSKVLSPNKPEENAKDNDGPSGGKRKDSSSRISKSTRRRLLFG